MGPPMEDTGLRVAIQNGALVVLVLISCLLYSGLVFGWAPFVLMLKDEGYFLSGCLPEESTCASQDNQLNLVYTIASTTVSLAGFPAGLILDSFGPLITTAIAGTIECAGLVLIALSNTDGEMTISGTTIPQVFTVGVVLLAIGGALYMFAAFHATYTWPQYQAFLMASISCLFDGSTVTFAAMYFLHSTFGYSQDAIFLVFTVITAVLTVLIVLAWSLYCPPPARSSSSSTVRSEEGITQPLLRESGDIHDSSNMNNSTEHKILLCEELDEQHVDLTLSTDEAVNALHESTIWTQMGTFHFLFILLASTIHIIRSNFFLGTVNMLLEGYGDRTTGYLVTEIVGYIIPCGFLAIPFIGFSVKLFGTVRTVQLVNVMGIVYGATSLVSNLKLQYFTAGLYTTYRAFFFSTSGTYNAETFGKRTLGRIQGILFITAGFLNLLMNPIVRFTNKYLDGDLFWPNLLLLFCVVPVVILTEAEHRRNPR